MKPISLNRLELLLSGFAGKRVLVVGDIYLYEYIWGRMTEISTEGPVPVVHVHDRSYAAGAAGNTAAGLAALGAEVSLCGCIGDDANGHVLKETLRRREVDLAPLVAVNDFKTNTYTKISAGGFHSSPQEVLRTHTMPPPRLDEAAENAICTAITDMAPEVDALVLVDQISNIVTRKVIDLAIELRRDQNIFVVGDSRENVRDMRCMDLIVPNDYEAGNAVNLPIDCEADVLRAGEMLLGCQNLQNVIITRGREGMAVFSRGVQPLQLRTHALDVFDVTGAGDTVTAATTLTMLAGGNAMEAAQVANLAAGVAVSKVGTVTVDAGDILQAHAQHEGVAPSQKIKTVEQLKSIVEELRKEGCKIAWTNGCFDILHTGHLTYLRKARRTGDVLLVGISGDTCVRKLKGEGRPINREQERAELIAEMSCVDYVVIFEEESPAHIIERLKPDVYVKGGDYTIDTINQTERQIVENYGGGIQLLGHVEGSSTTDIIGRILRQNNNSAR